MLLLYNCIIIYFIIAALLWPLSIAIRKIHAVICLRKRSGICTDSIYGRVTWPKDKRTLRRYVVDPFTVFMLPWNAISRVGRATHPGRLKDEQKSAATEDEMEEWDENEDEGEREGEGEGPARFRTARQFSLNNSGVSLARGQCVADSIKPQQ